MQVDKSQVPKARVFARRKGASGGGGAVTPTVQKQRATAAEGDAEKADDLARSQRNSVRGGKRMRKLKERLARERDGTTGGEGEETGSSGGKRSADGDVESMPDASEAAAAAAAAASDAGAGAGADADASKESKRSKKRQKLAGKQEAGSGAGAESAAAPSPGVLPALAYLRAWQNDRKSWKFQKLQQVYLLRHWYNGALIPKADFEILASYLEGLKGGARAALITEARNVLEADDSDEEEEAPAAKKAKKVAKSTSSKQEKKKEKKKAADESSSDEDSGSDSDSSSSGDSDRDSGAGSKDAASKTRAVQPKVAAKGLAAAEVTGFAAVLAALPEGDRRIMRRIASVRAGTLLRILVES